MGKVSLVKYCVTLLAVFVLAKGIDGETKRTFAQEYGLVQGRVVSTGGTLPAGTLAFFAATTGSDPGDRNILRIPERTALVDEEGRFAVNIQYGHYYLGYFPGKQKNNPGLPEKGFEPLLAGTNDSDRYILTIPPPQTDTGDIHFYSLKKDTVSPSFKVSGTIRTDTGRPVAGISVVAKKDLQIFRPQYISMPTGRSGKYSITLPPGDFYLIARYKLETYGRPKTGEYFGMYGVEGPAGEFGWFPIKKDQDIAIHGNEGEDIAEADITVFRIPDPVAQEEALRSKGKK